MPVGGEGKWHEQEEGDWTTRLTLGTDLVALEVQPGVVEAGRSLDHHVDINRQLEAGVARAG